MICGVGQPQGLYGGGGYCDDGGAGEGGGAVAAKLRTAGHLPADAADVAESSVEIVHANSLCIAK